MTDSHVRDVDDSLNYYDVLGVATTATEKEIRRAYQKKGEQQAASFFFFSLFSFLKLFIALKLHPDKQKNPTPASLKEFHNVQVAYELLTDAEARKALDAVLGAKVRAAAKRAALSSKRAALQKDLERREREAQNRHELERAQQVLRSHMDRIRAENMRRMQRDRSQPKQHAEEPPAAKKAKPTLKPYSQQFASLPEFEAFAFERLLATSSKE